MAARQSIIRPLRAAVNTSRTTSSTTKNAVRTFATTACRAKELAGDTHGLPNMRQAQRTPVGTLNVPIVNPAGKAQGIATRPREDV